MSRFPCIHPKIQGIGVDSNLMSVWMCVRLDTGQSKHPRLSGSGGAVSGTTSRQRCETVLCPQANTDTNLGSGQIYCHYSHNCLREWSLEVVQPKRNQFKWGQRETCAPE